VTEREYQHECCSNLSERLQAVEQRLQAEAQTRDTETSDLYRQVALLRSQLEELRSALLAGRSEATLGNVVHLSDTREGWRTEASLETLRIIGSTGDCRHSDLIQALQCSGAVCTADLRSGSARRPFERLLQHGLIEAITVSQDAGGRPVSLFRLTYAGREEYRRLWSQPPAESTYDRLLRRHKSPEHVLLNLQAAEILRSWADAVDLYPSRLQVPGLGVFDPDIVAVAGGKPLYVECERGHGKARDQQRAKWHIHAAASAGQLHLFVPNRPTQDRVVRQVARWAEESRADVVLRVSAISLWRQQKLPCPWMLEQEYRFGVP